jgi:hypothetical protein
MALPAWSIAVREPSSQNSVTMEGGERQTPMKATMLGWRMEAMTPASCNGRSRAVHYGALASVICRLHSVSSW